METRRSIVHLDLDSFFVSVERLQNSKLIGKPVIIGGLSDRGVVASCSYEARSFGVHSAMPMRMARRLCNDAIVIRGDMDLYSEYSDIVTEIIDEKAPLYEKASIDEHYVDLTGMERFFGTLSWAEELKTNIRKHTGLPVSFGLSENKTVSKIATGEAKPDGALKVSGENIKPFLYPLSIRKIPMIGNKTFRLLRSMGVSKIKTLSQMPVEMLESVLGKNGTVLWKKAHGIDPAPVIPYHESKSISAERTFERDTMDIHGMNSVLVEMVEKLAYRLRQENKLTSCVTIKIRYANYDTQTMQKRIPYTSFDHHILEVAKELFRKLYTRRMLIRLLGVKFTRLVQGTQQLNLFEDTRRVVHLYQTMDRIRNMYGKHSIGRASGKSSLTG
ncbi:MAG: DNA polymerase IV [Bacteroidota bacterium]